MDNFDLRKYLAEGRLLKEDTNPVWKIDSFEDNADISQAGPEFKTAVSNIIKAKHPNISDKDLEASIEVMNVTWHDEARSNSKGSDPEDMEVSAEDFAEGAIEHYEDILMYDGGKDKDSSPSYQKWEDWAKSKNLGEGRLLKESAGYVYASCDREALSVWTQEEFDTYVEDIAEGDGTSKEEALEYLKDEQMLTKLPNSPYLLVYADDESLDFISANTKEEFVNEVNDNSFDGQLEGEVDAMFAEICSIADDSSIDGDSAAQQIVIENGKIVGGDNSKAW